MKSVIVKKIKTLTLILLIIFAVLSVNLFMPGCNKNLINDDGSSNEKTATSKNISQQYTNIDSQINKTHEEKTDGETNKTTKYEALGFETKDFLRIDIKSNSWILNVIDSNGNLKYQEEITFN